ncbi:MAG: hypothetical protein RR540_05650 [Oscillospiraceae bacterium]
MKKSIFKRAFSMALSMVLVLGIGTIGVSAEEGTENNLFCASEGISDGSIEISEIEEAALVARGKALMRERAYKELFNDSISSKWR